LVHPNLKPETYSLTPGKNKNFTLDGCVWENQGQETGFRFQGKPVATAISAHLFSLLPPAKLSAKNLSADANQIPNLVSMAVTLDKGNRW